VDCQARGGLKLFEFGRRDEGELEFNAQVLRRELVIHWPYFHGDDGE
jgi:hypothetical protein